VTAFRTFYESVIAEGVPTKTGLNNTNALK